MSLLPTPTWIAGCGNMAGAMVEGWRAAGVDLSGTVAMRPSGTPVEGIRTVGSYSEAGNPPKLLLLCFKPQKLDEAAEQLKPWVTSKTVIVSILAGVETDSLRHRFPRAAAIVRAMPNLPVAIRRGVVALYSKDADEAQRADIGQLFATLGMAAWTADETGLGAIGSVAGAGPAYVARFIAALAVAGEARGLDPALARTIALETVLGTAWMAASTQESMDALVKRVASPNGTTEAGLAVLDPELDELVGRTIQAAAQRGAELAEQARSS